MKSIKEEALRAISSLPDNAPIEEVMYRLYVIDKVAQGQEAIKNGSTITTEELLKEIESW
jgi:predicted transcriptional regulator